MSSAFNISRGNPRSSSVGEKSDVSEVSYRSASAIDMDEIVQIIDCGIPLRCGETKDSIDADPCEDLDLTFYNVMGQEDRFRQIDGKRANRGGTARIVFTARQDVVIEKIDYVVNPQNEDNPTFTDQWNPTPPSDDKHEVFVNVSPDSLYAFQITISVEGCPDTNTSGIYYFSTGDSVVFKPDPVKLADYLIEIKTDLIDVQKTVLGSYTDGNSTVIPNASGQIQSVESNTVYGSLTSLQESITVTTSFNTS